MHRVVPELIVENYRAGRFGGEFHAVGMFLDLSGFSKMTDILMQHGQHGAEILAGLMHGVFNPLVESIFDYGGKIVSFAGDGIMALYPVTDDEKTTALRALTSAWVIQRKLKENPDRKTMYGKFTFSAKVGLATGSVMWKILHSDDGKNATYYFRGSAVNDSAKAEHQAKSGEIILTQEMNNLLEEDIRSRPSELFHQFIRFRVEMPKKITNDFPPVDLDISRIFMPEEVIVEGMRGEFRQIANLFIRIPDLPDDELENFVNVVFELRKKYGGLVTRLDFGDKGCNMLMLWGAPLAYENDIGRTMNFILDLRAKVDVPITAGVTYYIAHAGYLGSELCEDYTCYGWGVNLSARFMMTAPEGEIWVDDRVAQRVSQRFSMDYVGSQKFKGFAAEQKVHVLRYRKMESDVIYLGEMVGRETELKRMEEFVEPLWRGEFGGVLTVSGEAGIGKGRLVHEFSSSDVFNLHNVYWANCKADQILRGSFNPLRVWMLRYFRIELGHSTDQKKDVFNSKLDDLLASIPDPELAHELERTRSFLGALLDLHWGNSLYEQLDAEARYNNTILSLIALLKAESLRQPVILFIDDIQYVDTDTIAFLTQLKRSVLAGSHSYPIGIIFTLRKQGEYSSFVGEFSDSEILLIGMTRAAIQKLVENILDGAASLNLMELVLVRSEGNPFFAEQVVRYLLEEDQLKLGDNGWEKVESVQESVLPGDIRALLVARLDKLTREVKSAVQTASVLGREFDIGVLSQMLGSEVTTRDRVNDAEKAAIWSPLNEMLYIFHHGLLRDAAYSMQMHARRQELHILALNALEDLYGDELDRHYAELAYHAEHGNSRSKAQRYYTLAGKTSSDLYRNSEALEYYTKALALTDFDDHETQFDLLVERVELYARMGERDLQINDLDSLDQRAEQLKDSDRLAIALMLRSQYSFYVGNYQEAIERALRAAHNVSESLRNSERALYTQIVWSTALLRLGKLDEAMVMSVEVLEKTRTAGFRRLEADVLSSVALIALEQNNISLARHSLDAAMEIANDLNDPKLKSKTLNNLAMVEESNNGNYALAQVYYEESLRLSREAGDRVGEINSFANLGFVASMQGDFEDAQVFYEKSIKHSREIDYLHNMLYTFINLSALAGILSDASSALNNAQEAMDLAKKTSDVSGEAWAYHYMGHAYQMLGDYKAAETVYKKSIVLREGLQQPILATEPIAGLIEIYLSMNEIDAAMHEAEKILELLSEGSPLDRTDEPLRVYHAVYLLLKKIQDPRSKQVLQKAKNLLDIQISNFKDNASQRRYIDSMPWRRAIHGETL
ncbi:MAG TPA: tetratricopeptide repeat protein [Anaerolineales bacterium]|nr:tetratricopeptide repeat protein [Anaerolineales bacterium]